MGAEHVERTFIAFKPDAVQRGLVGEILQRFEKAGFHIAAAKMVYATDEKVSDHYEEHQETWLYPVLKEYIQESPIFAVVLEGANAAERVRKLVGPTNPSEAPPGTIRGDYAHVNHDRADERDIALKNLLHAAESSEEAEREIAIWFDEEEIHDYQRADFEHVL